MKYSLIIPVYANYDSLPELLMLLTQLQVNLQGKLEVIFVIDASPDNAYGYLEKYLPTQTFASQLILLSKNYGSFSAIMAGLSQARGQYFAVMAADLQEPPELVLAFFNTLENQTENIDIAFGVRESRQDPFLTRICSKLFWFFYRKCIQKAIPPGGVDMFACNQLFRQHLLSLRESHSSLIGLLFWMGFSQKFITYARLPRKQGKSAWTFSKKFKYFSDSLFSFSDLPIKLLFLTGMLSFVFCALFGLFLIFAKLFFNLIHVPGYTSLLLTVLFFTGINTFGLGIIGSYAWRAFENSKNRPNYIISKQIFIN